MRASSSWRSRAKNAIARLLARHGLAESPGSGGVQDVEARAVAEVDLEAELGGRLDPASFQCSSRHRQSP
jgi:hypothetical protein